MPRKYCIPKFFARRRISCDQLPEHVYRRAKEIIEKLEDGAHFQSVDGKRMDFDKSKVSIPIGRGYRMFAYLQGNKVTITHLTTHENYNNLLKRRPRGGLSK
jgi:hypothetical protein